MSRACWRLTKQGGRLTEVTEAAVCLTRTLLYVHVLILIPWRMIQRISV